MQGTMSVQLNCQVEKKRKNEEQKGQDKTWINGWRKEGENEFKPREARVIKGRQDEKEWKETGEK